MTELRPWKTFLNHWPMSYTGTGREHIPSCIFSGVLGNGIRCEWQNAKPLCGRPTQHFIIRRTETCRSFSRVSRPEIPLP
jgi:hypothetical protein